jgi:hypothetical protein
MSDGDDPGCERHHNADRNDATQDRLANRSPYFRTAIAAFLQRITEHKKRKSDVPDLVKPGCRLRTGIEQPGRRKQTRKGQGVDDRCDRGKQISAREQQQRPPAQNRELRKHQEGGDEVVDCKRGLITSNERRNRRKRYSGVNRRADEQNRRDADDGESPRTVTVGGRQGRKKDVAFVARLHRRLRQTGIERAIATAPKRADINLSTAAAYLADMRIPTGRTSGLK